MSAPEERIPDGYRQSIVTAITVFLGFSITFLRTFRHEEARGGWTTAERISEAVIAVGIILQVVSLFRALDVVDNTAARYRHTRRMFIAGVLVVIAGALSSVLGSLMPH